MPYFNIGDIRLHYREAGAGQPTLIFIHGYCGRLEHWKEQISYFGKTHRVIAYDVRGHGRSSKPRGKYTLDIFLSDLRHLIKGLGLQSVVLIGHSMGGNIAMDYASSFQSDVKALVIVDAGVASMGEAEYQRAAKLVRVSLGDYLKSRVDSNFLPTSDPELRARVWEDWRATPEYVARPLQLDILERWREKGRDGLVSTTSLKVPTLICYQAETKPGREQAYKKFSRSFANCTFERFRGVGHYIMLEAPDRFNQVLAGFLRSLR